jgi:hypothetical protein
MRPERTTTTRRQPPAGRATSASPLGTLDAAVNAVEAALADGCAPCLATTNPAWRALLGAAITAAALARRGYTVPASGFVQALTDPRLAPLAAPPPELLAAAAAVLASTDRALPPGTRAHLRSGLAMVAAGDVLDALAALGIIPRATTATTTAR